MKPLIYLDKINDDIAEEAINFSIFTIDNTQPKDDLISEISSLAEPSVFYYGEDDITDKTQRAIAAEIIR